ncbi:hypothetical protein LQZ19_00520 [Treponema primitia]|uniref:hypothetical protein n=1 Tax=Treponema primitia TaxID=88058 RepID=UPI0039817175
MEYKLDLTTPESAPGIFDWSIDDDLPLLCAQIPEQYWINATFCLDAVKNDARVLRYMPEKSKTVEVCKQF